MRWGAALMCVAACGGGTGVDLEIRSEVPIASVEIFIAHQPCTEIDPNTDHETPCREAIGWLDGQMPVEGSIYEMHSETFDKQTLERRLTPELQADGSTYGVRLVAEGDVAESKMIAIVGLDAAGEARALALIDDEIPEHTAEHWIVTLQAVAPATAHHDWTDGDPERRVAVWGRDGTPDQQTGSRCLVMQEWTGVDYKSKFIVPASDHDCDGVAPTLECDTQYFHLNEQRPAACATVAELDSSLGTGACTLGLSTCRDGSPYDGRCLIPPRGTASSIRMCVPDKVCEVCDGPYGVVPCVQTLLEDMSGVSHASCRLYGNASGGGACGQAKPGSIAKLVLPFTDCESIDVRPIGMPQANTQSTEIVVKQATFAAAVTNVDMCTMEVHFKGGTVVNGTSEWIILGVYPFTSATAIMLIPIKLVFPTGGIDCDGGLVPETCSISGLATDRIKSCGL